MRRLLIALLVVSAACGRTPRVRADEPAGPVPLTAFEQGPWSRSPLVVLGDVIEVRALDFASTQGVDVARVRVERALKGEPPGSEILVLVAGPRSTRDAAPYLPRGRTGRYVLFLVRRGEGVALHLESLIEADGVVGEERIASLDAEIALLRIPDVEERARRTLAHFLRSLVAPGDWTRVHAARELNQLAIARPGLFDEGVRRRISAIAESPGPPARRTWLRRLLQRVGAAAPGHPGAGPTETTAVEAEAELVRTELADAGEDRGARRAVLDAFVRRAGSAGAPVLLALFGTEEADVRTFVVTTLSEAGVRGALPSFRAAYAREADADVRAGIVRATGLLGTARDVPWLAERLANPRLRTEALFALARIRTEEARRLVLEEGRRAREAPDGPEDADVPRLCAYLLGPAFVESERAAGRLVGPGTPPAENDGGGGGTPR